MEIKGIAREAGSRAKVAVASDDDNIDPIGACIGQRGARIQTIISELGGEKVDIIEYSENPEVFISNSLSPAKVDEVEIDEEEKTAVVKVDSDQLSLAIGKGGQNVRLAAKLMGWKINISEINGEISVEAEGDTLDTNESDDSEESSVEDTTSVSEAEDVVETLDDSDESDVAETKEEVLDDVDEALEADTQEDKKENKEL